MNKKKENHRLEKRRTTVGTLLEDWEKSNTIKEETQSQSIPVNLQ